MMSYFNLICLLVNLSPNLLQRFKSICSGANFIWLVKKIVKRCKVYLALNGLLALIAAMSYVGVSWGQRTSLIAEAASVYTTAVLRMLSCVLYFEGIKTFGGWKRIHDKDSSREDFWGALGSLFFVAGLMEIFNMMASTRVEGLFTPSTSPTAGNNYFMEYLLFIPKSLVCELILDFGHYWTHRLCHRNKVLFRWLHAEHHSHDHPGPLSTFAQSYLDIVITNIIPMHFAFRFGPTLTVWQFHLFMSYKTFIEVAGHSGLDLNGASFPQFPFLGWCTNFMVLHNQEHSWHHVKPTANFSKRFSVWDRLFGTYEASKHHRHHHAHRH